MSSSQINISLSAKSFFFSFWAYFVSRDRWKWEHMILTRSNFYLDQKSQYSKFIWLTIEMLRKPCCFPQDSISNQSTLGYQIVTSRTKKQQTIIFCIKKHQNIFHQNSILVMNANLIAFFDRCFHDISLEKINYISN